MSTAPASPPSTKGSPTITDTTQDKQASSEIQSIIEKVTLGDLTAADAALLITALKAGEGGDKGNAKGERDGVADVCKEMIRGMRRAEEEKKEPWRAEAAAYRKRFNEMAALSTAPDTRAVLQATFEDRVKSGLTISPEVVYILHYLLYCDEPHVNAPLYLANTLLYVNPVERLKMHNWLVYAASPEPNKVDIARAITSGQLQYPLFPCASLFDWNRVLADEALQKLQGAGPGQNTEKPSYARRLFGAPRTQEPLVGGGPQTSIGVYVPGNPEAVAHADTTPISDGMTELATELARMREQNANLKRQVAGLERKVMGNHQHQSGQLSYAPPTSARGGGYGTRGGNGGRGATRGVNRGGRGYNSHNNHSYYGAGAPEGAEQYDEAQYAPKNE